MKAARPRNTPVSQQRINAWLASFIGYRHAVSEMGIQNWLRQFAGGDRDLAARLLDVVDFVPLGQLDAIFRQLLNGLPGWNADATLRQGRWAFSAFSSSAGESGDSMLHRFRLANGLGAKQHGPMFLHRSELLKAGFGPTDTVVFVDDFAGTGNQVVESWDDYFHEVVPDSNLYLMLAGATSRAIQRIANSTPLIVTSGIQLDASDDIFDNACAQFSAAEKARVLHYCTTADRKVPRGYGDCGLVVVFAHNCPNNTIPIMHASNGRWTGLFPRRQ